MWNQKEQSIRRVHEATLEKKGMKPLVGDFVQFSTEENSEGYVLDIKERKNQLVRPAIANIDQAVIVMSTVSPNFSLNLLDRFLVFLENKKNDTTDLHLET